MQKVKDFLKTKNGKMAVGAVVGLIALILIAKKFGKRKRSHKF